MDTLDKVYVVVGMLLGGTIYAYAETIIQSLLRGIKNIFRLFDWIRPGKQMQKVNENLTRIAERIEQLPSPQSLTELIGQVEKLERVLSKRARQLSKEKATTPKHLQKHVNGEA
jgi:DNA repair ATPase RecN